MVLTNIDWKYIYRDNKRIYSTGGYDIHWNSIFRNREINCDILWILFRNNLIHGIPLNKY